MASLAEQDRTFMRLALEQAALAPALGEVPVAALLVRDGAILARAHNAREIEQDPTAHAEMIVIREAAAKRGAWRLTGTTLYVTLEPCAMCVGAILHARIDRLVFGAWDSKAGACGSLFDLPAEPRLNHRLLINGGVLETESRALLQDFFQRLRDKALPETS